MGMYDYVTHEGKRYQSKDTPDQGMSEYRIVGGRLLGDEWHYEMVPESERPDPQCLILGCMRRIIDTADVDLNWHGYLYMSAGEEEQYATYRAKFTDGNLVEFIKSEEL